MTILSLLYYTHESINVHLANITVKTHHLFRYLSISTSGLIVLIYTKIDLNHCGACPKRFRSSDRKRMLSASPDLCKGLVAITDEIGPLEKVIPFMSNAHAGRLKVNSTRINPIELVCAMATPVEIVNHCRLYTKSVCG